MDKTNLEKPLLFIDSWLAFLVKRYEFPGMSVAISHRGKIVFNKSYGFANIEKKEKLTPQHVFRIASHSKTFTATAILQLAEQGRLRIDDYVVQYLPWLSVHKDVRFQKVTIRQLLSHSAGIIRDGLDSDFWAIKKPFPDKKQLIDEILKSDLIIDNNTCMKYSNYGFGLLGLIIENIKNESYNDYVKKNIIESLKLKNTGPEYTEKIKNFVTGYTRKDRSKRQPMPDVDTKALSPATGFYSTAEDLCLYFNAQILGTNQLLSDESKKEMQKTQWKVKNRKNEEYGLGMDITYHDKIKVIGHSGGFPGQRTRTFCSPDEQIVVVVLLNFVDGESKSVTSGVLKTLRKFMENDSRKVSQNLDKFTGRFMNLSSVTDIVVLGNKIIAADPNLWEPFNDPEELEYVKNNTFKIVKTDSFGSEGELVQFNLDEKGKVESVIFAGATMLPEDKYLESIKI